MLGFHMHAMTVQFYINFSGTRLLTSCQSGLTCKATHATHRVQVNPLDRAATVGLEQLTDIPGTVRYFLRSAPEMLEEALAMNWNDFAKQLDLLRLVRLIAAITS